MLEGLCGGLLPTELPSALQGLLFSESHVRAAALDALSVVPCLAAGGALFSWVLCHGFCRLGVHCIPARRRTLAPCCSNRCDNACWECSADGQQSLAQQVTQTTNMPTPCMLASNMPE